MSFHFIAARDGGGGVFLVSHLARLAILFHAMPPIAR